MNGVETKPYLQIIKLQKKKQVGNQDDKLLYEHYDLPILDVQLDTNIKEPIRKIGDTQITDQTVRVNSLLFKLNANVVDTTIKEYNILDERAVFLIIFSSGTITYIYYTYGNLQIIKGVQQTLELKSSSVITKMNESCLWRPFKPVLQTTKIIENTTENTTEKKGLDDFPYVYYVFNLQANSDIFETQFKHQFLQLLYVPVELQRDPIKNLSGLLSKSIKEQTKLNSQMSINISKNTISLDNLNNKNGNILITKIDLINKLLGDDVNLPEMYYDFRYLKQNKTVEYAAVINELKPNTQMLQNIVNASTSDLPICIMGDSTSNIVEKNGKLYGPFDLLADAKKKMQIKSETNIIVVNYVKDFTNTQGFINSLFETPTPTTVFEYGNNGFIEMATTTSNNNLLKYYSEPKLFECSFLFNKIENKNNINICTASPEFNKLINDYFSNSIPVEFTKSLNTYLNDNNNNQMEWLSNYEEHILKEQTIQPFLNNRLTIYMDTNFDRIKNETINKYITIENNNINYGSIQTIGTLNKQNLAVINFSYSKNNLIKLCEKKPNIQTLQFFEEKFENALKSVETMTSKSHSKELSKSTGKKIFVPKPYINNRLSIFNEYKIESKIDTSTQTYNQIGNKADNKYSAPHVFEYLNTTLYCFTPLKENANVINILDYVNEFIYESISKNTNNKKYPNKYIEEFINYLRKRNLKQPLKEKETKIYEKKNKSEEKSDGLYQRFNIPNNEDLKMLDIYGIFINYSNDTKFYIPVIIAIDKQNSVFISFQFININSIEVFPLITIPLGILDLNNYSNKKSLFENIEKQIQEEKNNCIKQNKFQLMAKQQSDLLKADIKLLYENKYTNKIRLPKLIAGHENAYFIDKDPDTILKPKSPTNSKFQSATFNKIIEIMAINDNNKNDFIQNTKVVFNCNLEDLDEYTLNYVSEHMNFIPNGISK